MRYRAALFALGADRSPRRPALPPPAAIVAIVPDLRASGYSGRKIGEVADFEIFATPKPPSDR